MLVENAYGHMRPIRIGSEASLSIENRDWITPMNMRDAPPA
jgi:hypothetical protein